MMQYYLFEYVDDKTMGIMMRSCRRLWNHPQFVEHRKFKREGLPSAASNGNIECVRYLLKKKHYRRRVHNYAIYAASSNGHLNIVLDLMNWYPFDNIPHQNALLYACKHGQLDIVTYLTTRWNKNVRYIGDVARGRFDSFYYRLDSDSYYRREPTIYCVCLREATRRGHLEIVKFLTGESCGYDNRYLDMSLNILQLETVGPFTDQEGFHVLMRSLWKGHPIERIKLLYSVWDYKKESIFKLIRKACEFGNFEAIQFITSRNERGICHKMKALEYAIDWNQPDTVQYLMKNSTVRQKERHSAKGLVSAIKNRDLEAYNYLKMLCSYKRCHIKKAYRKAADLNMISTVFFILRTMAQNETNPPSSTVTDFRLIDVQRALETTKVIKGKASVCSFIDELTGLKSKFESSIPDTSSS